MADLDFVRTLVAAKRGDERAFAQLFRQAQPAVLRYLRVVGGSRAEDLAGETWLQVVRGLARFEATEPAAFRGWVLSIARHRWLDDQRARGRRPEVLAAELPEDRGSGDDVAGEVEHIITTEEALRLVQRLPADQAEVVALRYITDLDVSSTAELVGKPPGSVRVLAHRGLRRLETMLTGHVPDERGVTPSGSGTVGRVT